MRELGLGLLLAGLMGTAWAGDYGADGHDRSEDNYSATLFYRLEFGGTPDHAHSAGLRFDHEALASYGAPPLLQAAFEGAAQPTFRLRGLPVTGPALASGADGQPGFFSGFSVANWITLAFTTVIFAAVISEAADTADEPSTGGTTGIAGG